MLRIKQLLTLLDEVYDLDQGFNYKDKTEKDISSLVQTKFLDDRTFVSN